MQVGTRTRRTEVTPRGQGRDALCAALVRVVAREGLDGVTFRSVAKEAGVTHGLASYHFRTREAMISAALTWAVDHAIEASRLGAEAETIGELAADVPELIADAPEEAAFQFRLALESLARPELLEEVKRTYDAYVETVRQTLVRLGLDDGEALARLVFAAVDGLSLQQLMYGEPIRTEEALARLRDLLETARRPPRLAASP
jgi:AcrR family transcriptional regulator